MVGQKHKIAAGQPLTMTEEFGPLNDMAATPNTRQPLADLGDVNAHMLFILARFLPDYTKFGHFQN